MGPQSPPELTEPDALVESTFRLTLGRRNRQYGANRLPTLDESDSSDASSFDESDPVDSSLSPPRRSNAASSSDFSSPERAPQPRAKDKVQKHNKLAGPPAAPRPKIPPTGRERIADIIEQADALAATGSDDAAVTHYRKALKLTRSETSKIKQQLKKVDASKHHPTTIPSIHSRLHEDWLDVGKSIVDIRQKMAVLCERVGDYEHATANGKGARAVLDKQHVFLTARKATFASRLAETSEKIKEIDALMDQMKISQSSFDDRKAMHEQIIVLRKQIEIEDNPRIKQDLLATTTLKVQKALQTETRVLGLRHPQVADTLSLLAALAQERGMIESSREYMREALDIAMEVLGERHPNTGEMLLQAARIYVSQEYQQAMEYYTRAVAIFRECKHSPLVGLTLNEMSVLQIRRKQLADAMVLLEEALETFHSAEGESEFAAVAAQVYRNLGECYSTLKDYEKASGAYTRALQLQKDARKAMELNTATKKNNTQNLPHAWVDDEGLADTMRRLGKAYMYCGRHTEALSVYGEALLIHRSHVIKAVHPGRTTTALSDRQDQLAHTLFCVAEAREVVGDLDESLKVYSESMQLRLFSDAHRIEKRLNMVHCAMCLRGIGNIHMARKEFDAAKKVYEDALRYTEAHGLTETHAIVVMIKKAIARAAAKEEQEPSGEQKSDKDEAISPKRSQLALGVDFPPQEQIQLMDTIAHLERESKEYVYHDEYERAVESLTKLMAARKALLKLLKSSHKDSSNEKYATACTLLTFGKVLSLKGDSVNATRALEDAIKLFKKNGLSRDMEGVNEAQLALKALRS